MEVDGVFSGGGVKAFAFLGALEAFHDRNITFKRVAGSSAGAIIASLIAAGYQYEEINKIFYNHDFTKFLDPRPIAKTIPFIKWISLYFRLGLYRGQYIENWVDQLLMAKGIKTFGDLDEQKLFIIGADVSLGRLVVFPDDLQHLYQISPSQFPVSKAVRASISIPYFFEPVKIHTNLNTTSLIIDGGMISNFPYWLFARDSKLKVRPTLGIKLSAQKDLIPDELIHNAFDLLPAIFWTMQQAHDTRYVSKNEAKDVLFIPIENISATDFDINHEEREYLYQLGKSRAQTFLKTWSK